MKYLLDTNALLAALYQQHTHFAAMQSWCQDKQMAICPLSGLGFLRISAQPTGPFKVSMNDAESLLSGFVKQHACSFVPDDLPLDTFTAKSSKAVTDQYLACLADLHKMKLATFDSGIKHPAVEIIPPSVSATPAPKPGSTSQ